MNLTSNQNENWALKRERGQRTRQSDTIMNGWKPQWIKSSLHKRKPELDLQSPTKAEYDVM